ncbi:hypothetical protein KFE25_013049 [Diacronema lutheri]|uniref:Protein-S-isoprenylcysteine O-methyltransferase n=1 Tax=Diacronema lutheri TaxID=2081491 RepID=A0A8J6C9G8_DIALT|nr:hypothetical protein KFE25_013049 [Diacronema lutheri]
MGVLGAVLLVGLAFSPSHRGRPRALGSRAPAAVRQLAAPFASASKADQGATDGAWFEGLRSGVRRGLRNISDGEPGQRGEAYVGVQLLALILVVFGDLPGLPLLRLLHLILGPLCVSSGCVLVALAAFRLGSNLSPWPVPVAENVLQTTGAYAWCRHPMYVGLLVLALGCATMAQSVPRALVTVCLGLCLRAQALVEERRLRERHAKVWDSYAASTPRFIPAAFARLPLERVQRAWSGDRSQ